MSQLLESKLRQYFGYSTFRDQQKEIINHVVSGKHTVVLLPPLIALTQDQVQVFKKQLSIHSLKRIYSKI